VGQDWAAVAAAMSRRLAELGMRQRDLAERAHVSQAIVRELQHNTRQRRRSARTLEALSVALGWHPRYLQALLDGQPPPDGTEPAVPPADLAGRLSVIEAHLRSIEQRLIDVQSRLDSRDGG
jgi:transcriptional regulator with XRE-family HTH domain